jgi:hypothetical protein
MQWRKYKSMRTELIRQCEGKVDGKFWLSRDSYTRITDQSGETGTDNGIYFYYVCLFYFILFTQWNESFEREGECKDAP